MRRQNADAFLSGGETQRGGRRIPNEEIAKAARDNSEVTIAFASTDPLKAKAVRPLGL